MITKFFDIRYHINTKDDNDNKELDSKEEKIILVSSKDNISLLNHNNNIEEYFIDLTFKLTPKIHRPYKIMTISCYDKAQEKILAIMN